MMVVRSKLASSSPKRPFSKEDQPAETFVLDRSHEPLGVGVQVGRPRRQANDLDAGISEQIPEGRRVFRIPIKDDELLAREESIDGVGEISPDLPEARGSNAVAARSFVASAFGHRRLHGASSRRASCAAAACCTRLRTGGPRVASQRATEELERTEYTLASSSG